MIITGEKIVVTYGMMIASGMVRQTLNGMEFGVPDGRGNLKWAELIELDNDDFDAIENYFLNKKLIKLFSSLPLTRCARNKLNSS